MRIGRWVLAGLLPGSLSAHPHARVDQQAHLSLGRTEAVVTYYLAPSARDGGHMFDHLDADRDGLLNRAERASFAAALLDHSRLSVDGSPRRLTATHVAVPERRVMATGRGVVRLRARARLRPAAGARHRLTLNVYYRRFAGSWYVQPYYAPGLAGSRDVPIVERRPGSSAVTIIF